jgi:hypothetical protein
MKMNQQNLPRVNPYKPQPSDSLRNSIRAPEGYKVVVADLSGIELRVNHFLWKVPSSMSLFQADPEKADLYKDFASRLYEIGLDDVTKEQRQVGKVAHLGLGFGSGHITFQKVAKLMGGVDITEGESKDIVDKWRKSYGQIQRGWRTCHDALVYMKEGSKQRIAIDKWGLCHAVSGGIETPMGMIRYPHLRQEQDEESRQMEWWYGEGRKKARIYAGKITENIVQHLAREVICDHALAVAKTPLGKMYPLAHTVHDELIYVVRDEHAQEMLDTVQNIMRNGVTWWPELVTWSEGDIAQTYGEAK